MKKKMIRRTFSICSFLSACLFANGQLLTPLGAIQGSTGGATSHTRMGPKPWFWGEVQVSNDMLINTGPAGDVSLQVYQDVPAGSTALHYGVVSQVNTNNAVGAHGGYLTAITADARNGVTSTAGLSSSALLSQTGAAAATEVTGLLGQATISQSYPSSFLRAGQLKAYPSGTVNAAYGLETTVYGSGGTMANAYGFYGRVNAGTISGSAYGFYGLVDGVGTATSAYGGYGLCAKGTTRYGLRGEATNAGSFTTLYGVYGKAPFLQPIGSLPNTWTSFAGYFEGHIYATGSAFFVSDQKFKKDIEKIKGPLAIVLELKPRTYTFDAAKNPGIELPSGKQFGLIAQELEQVLPELIGHGRNPEKHGEDGRLLFEAIDYKAVNYIGLIPVTIGAIQEQQVIIEEQQERIAALTSRLDKLEADKAAADDRTGLNSVGKETTGLFQNEPNPFNETTVIRYQLPSTVTKASLELYGATGQVAQRFEGLAGGQGQIMIAAGALGAGTYTYTLVVDGKRMDTKTMVITE
jgi:Chaperone of endosialidase